MEKGGGGALIIEDATDARKAMWRDVAEYVEGLIQSRDDGSRKIPNAKFVASLAAGVPR